MKLTKAQYKELEKHRDYDLRNKLKKDKDFRSEDIWDYGSMVEIEHRSEHKCGGVLIFIPYVHLSDFNIKYEEEV